MTYWFRLMILSLLGSAGALADDTSGETAPAPNDTLRVLCYNIHYGQGNDGVYDLNRLAAVMAKHRPDLVALQEVDVNAQRSGKVHQAKTLGDALKMNVYLGPTQHFQGGLYGNAILSRLPVSSVHIQPLPYTEATQEQTTYPRGYVSVVAQTPSGQEFCFISTHFQHNLESDRIEQARQINADLAPANTPSLPSILAGDFNALPDSAPIAILTEEWHHATKTPGTPTYPSAAPDRCIDYIFFRSEDQWELIESTVIDDGVASDHRPVLAVLKLKPKQD